MPFLDQARALSSCFNEVVIPWSNDQVDPVAPGGTYPFKPFGRVFEETAYGLSGIASESRSGDANGQYIRVEAGGGQNTVKIPDAIPSLTGGGLQDAVALLQFPILGAMPRIDDSEKTPFKPNQPCERQEQPNLAAGLGQPPPSAGGQATAPDVPSLLSKFSPQQIQQGAEALGLAAPAAKQLSTLGKTAGGN